MGLPLFEVDERHPPIKARRVAFDWENTPLHWVPGNYVATHMINSFHLVLPEGERWFIQCVQDAKPLIKDEKLLEEIKGFIGQEMVHARAHGSFLTELLDRHGVDHRKITEAAKAGNDSRPADRAKMKPRNRLRMLRFELAAVSAIEHYTAVLGQWIMENDRLDKAGIDPTMLDLLRWHGAEEVEHRSVVFDVFKKVGGGYFTRVGGWVASVFFLYWALIAGAIFLVRNDPTIERKPSKLSMFRDYRRAARAGLVPSVFRLLIIEGLVYLKPGHHPSQVCSTPRALEYLMKSPAAQAGGYTPY
ncbi:metal-dependent hydrolase [Actinocorallia longicatena]|uniref:Metal-dependent hydrolase n=1 Tax=Actinocorallia longicatena TaxID=111803 RepID=A0ABP6Q794_9ACTN